MPLLYVLLLLIVGPLLLLTVFRLVVPLVLLAVVLGLTKHHWPFWTPQRLQVLTRGSVRQFARLQSATAALLAEEGQTVQAGPLDEDGFWMSGPSEEALSEAAHQALARLKSGDAPRATLVPHLQAWLMALVSLGFLLILLCSRQMGLVSAFMALMGAEALSAAITPYVDEQVLQVSLRGLTFRRVEEREPENRLMAPYRYFVVLKGDDNAVDADEADD